MSEKNKVKEKNIEEIIEQYSGQNEALEKLLKKLKLDEKEKNTK